MNKYLVFAIFAFSFSIISYTSDDDRSSREPLPWDSILPIKVIVPKGTLLKDFLTEFMAKKNDETEEDYRKRTRQTYYFILDKDPESN